MSMSSKTSIRNEDLLALQAYVTAKDDTQYDTLHKDTVVLDLTHSNLLQRHLEIRFDLHDTISSLRTKIYRKTGTPDAYQHLQLYRGGVMVAEIPPGSENDAKMLGFFGMQHGMRVHCVDLDPNSGSRNGQYEDVRLVEKYRMSDEDYDKRRGTLRDWERKQKSKDESFTLAKHAREHRELVEAQRQAKLGLPLPKGFEYDSSGKVVRIEEEMPISSKASNDDDAPGLETVQGKQVGMRCEVRPGGRRGVVAFVGEVPEIGTGGYWVGIVFDEPVGKTDGTVSGGKKRYFDAAPNYGGFARGKNVEVGDFPERDIMDELDSDSEDEL